MLCLVVYVWHSVSGVLTAREIWMLRLKIGMIIVYSCLMVMECRRRVRQGRYMFGDIVEIVMGVKEGVLMYVIVGYVESLVVERVLRKGGFK